MVRKMPCFGRSPKSTSMLSVTTNVLSGTTAVSLRSDPQAERDGGLDPLWETRDAASGELPPNTCQAPVCQEVDLSRRHERVPVRSSKARSICSDFVSSSRYEEPSSVPNTYRGSAVGA